MLQMRNKNGVISYPDSPPGFRPELFRVYAGQSDSLPADESRQVLNGYLGYLESELAIHNISADIGKSQEMLLEVSQFIESGNARVGEDVYQCVLGRLAGIYAGGLLLDGDNAYARTASDYADVIESISRVYPHYDYSEIVGQLIHYMNQLFSLRKKTWKTVYEHIASMPDSIEAINSLKTNYFIGLQQWAEEGVGNLFHIEDELRNDIAQLDREIAQVRRESIAEQRRLDLRRRGNEQVGGNLIDLEARRMAQDIESLQRIKQRLLGKRDGKVEVLDLIESNILEFESKLKATRRAVAVRLVYSAD